MPIIVDYCVHITFVASIPISEIDLSTAVPCLKKVYPKVHRCINHLVYKFKMNRMKKLFPLKI